MDASDLTENQPLLVNRLTNERLSTTSSSSITRISGRNHAFDNLRAFLTALVIFHHTAIVYGGAGDWNISSGCFPPESAILITFTAVDQTFFMALFFFMSGHFTRLQIVRRKGSKSTVLRSRLLRILLPAVIYTLLVPPTLYLMVWASGRVEPKSAFTNAGSIYISYWIHLRGINGPVWYLGLVMIFDIIAVLLSRSSDYYPVEKIIQYKCLWTLIAWVTVMLSSFAVRLVYPVGDIWPILSLQVAFLPQYILAYAGGHLSAATGNIFILLPFHYSTRRSLRTLDLSITALLITIGLATIFEVKVLGYKFGELSKVSRGGWNFPALFYAVWNELGFALVGFSLVRVFIEHANIEWTYKTLWLPRYSYGAYLLHPIISVAIELAVEDIMGCPSDYQGSRYGVWPMLGPILMTIIVGAMNIAATWIAAWGFVSTIPLVRKII
jgi:glucan biosynthesis protein C